MPDVYLIDASPYIFRAYYALPPTMTSPTGAPTNAIYGFADFLIQVLKKEQPQHLLAAFDGSLTTSFRNSIYPQYKAQRSLPPPELDAQLAACQQVAEAMGVTSFIHDEYESDDIIGTVVHRLKKEPGNRYVIVSSDKDFAQLVAEDTVLWDFARDRWFDSAAVQKKFGVPPRRIVDFMALTGDAVDNIPGVRGVGPKTASVLMKKFGSLEELYRGVAHESGDGIGIRGWPSVRRKLLAQASLAELSRQLVTIATDVPLDISLQDLQYRGIDKAKVARLFEEFGFRNLMSRIPSWAQ